MALSIVRASDALAPTPLSVLLYGQPGAKKTSIASTSNKPLLLDFDHGAKRSAYRCDTVQISSWAEVAQLSDADLAGYRTLVVDTAGRALDYLAATIPQFEAKAQMKRANGSLTLQGYGALKDSFAQWRKRISTLGLDVIFIAHDKEDKDGDTRIIRPDITGGSYGEIVRVCDFVGYVYVGDNRSTILDFNASDRWIGKNSSDLGPITVPHLFDGKADWFAGIMAHCKAFMGQVAERQKEAVAQLESLRGSLRDADDAEALMLLIDTLRDWVPALRVQAKPLIGARATELGLKFSRKTGGFVPIASEADEASP